MLLTHYIYEMNNDLLKTVFSAEEFRERGHQLIDELSEHLDRTINEKSSKVINWNLPKEEHDFWIGFLKDGDSDLLFTEIVKHSIHVHHPRYIGHQVSPTAPITVLSGMISAVLNNGMAVYEMGMASSAIERIVTDLLCKKIGYDSDSNGFLTSGGTLANLTALLSARKAKVSIDVWNKGHTKPLGIMVSEEAHYCVDRAAKIMGLGEEGIIKIQTGKNFDMKTSALEQRYKEATDAGIEIFAIVGSAPSTSTGIYDDLEAIANFSAKRNLWFHVDGAHGGAAIYSPKYHYTVKGIAHADSVVIDGHKMMMMPAITTALLYKDGKNSHTTFSQKADYLLEQSQEEDWYNMAKRTFECTKTMMAIHWFTLLKTYGEEIFDEFVTTLYDLGHDFAEMIKNNDYFELAVEPMSNIVCFRYVEKRWNEAILNKVNAEIRQMLLSKGEFYIVQTKLRGRHFLRVTIMNPFTTLIHLNQLLEEIKANAQTLTEQ